MGFSFHQLNTAWQSRCKRSLALTCSVLFFGIPAMAFVGDSGEVTQQPVITTPNALESKVVQFSAAQRYQVSGLNTRFNTALPWGELSMTGGLFFSQGLQRNAATATSPSLASNANSAFSLMSQLFSPKQADGKADQLLFQRVEYAASGLKLSGAYANTGSEFQGFNDLVKQMAPADAGMLGLGMTRSEYGVSYTGIRGLDFSSNFNSTENRQAGHKEHGLSRATESHKLALQLSPRTRMEYAINSVSDQWDQAVVKTAAKSMHSQAFNFSTGVAAKSSLSFGQTSSETLLGDTTSEKTLLRNMAVKWLDTPNFSLTGAYTQKENGLTNEEDTVYNVESKWQLSPRVTISDKWVDNTKDLPKAGQRIENDLLQLRLAATLAENLRFSSGYTSGNAPATGMVTGHEQQVDWQPLDNWATTTHFAQSNAEKIGETRTVEHTATGQLGSKSMPRQLTFSMRHDELPKEITQQRYQMNYSHALGRLPASGKILVHTGAADWTQGTEHAEGNMLALQAIGLQLAKPVTLSLGYYTGPRFGVGALNYRSWGHKVAGNTAALTRQDFLDYEEFGGELAYQPGKLTKLYVKQVVGELEQSGNHRMLEYGVEQRLGAITLNVSDSQAATPGKTKPIVRNTTLWKVTAPAKKPLAEWAKKSPRTNVVHDSAAWGFNQLPQWLAPAVPVSGLSAEKRQANDAGKPVDQYTLQGAYMLGRDVYVMASYEDNPLKPGTANVDHLQRSFVHVAVAARKDLQLFARYTEEDRHDSPMATSTMSLGVTGVLSATERLQFQVDALEQHDTKINRSGIGYMLAYDRTVSSDDTLSLRLRLQPDGFVPEQDAIRAELAYKRTF